MKISRFYSVLFLLLVVVVAYFPAVCGNYNTVDDSHIIAAYGVNGQQTLQKIFLPANQFYYRPIIELTYYFDNVMWDLDPSFMHLENIFLHALNVVLVYLLAAKFAAFQTEMKPVPFMSALLFAVHPAHTEAVSWIAGRTDILATSFILLSLFFLLTSLQTGTGKYFILYLIPMTLSLLVKETSIMMVPASCLLFRSIRSVTEANRLKVGRWLKQVNITIAVAVVGYFMVRVFLKPKGTDNAFSMLFERAISPTVLVIQWFQSLGFYVKKIFIPLPLNFAISTVPDWYLIPGVLSFALLIFLIRKNNLLTSLFAAAFTFITPAILVRIAGITWTPVAERYLYIPIVFFAMGLSACFLCLAKQSMFRFSYIMLVLIACGAGFVTFKRNEVWRDNFLLFDDAVKQSPEFGDIHNELGIALSKRGDYISARKHFALAQQLSKRPLSRELAELNLLNCELHGKNSHQKRDIIVRYIASHESVHPDLLRLLRAILYDLMAKEPKKNDEVRKEIIILNDRIFDKTKDPHCLYSNGRLMLELGNGRAAAEYFRKTITTAAPDAFYYEPAQKLIHRLETP